MSILTKWTLLLAAAFGAGCGTTTTTSSSGGETDLLASSGPIPRRTTSVEIDGCATDSWQNETLAADDTRAAVQEVILMCLAPREDGTIAPGDPSALAALVGTIQTLHELGYLVRLGVSFVDETGARFDGVQSASLLASETWRDSVITALVALAPDSDGFDLDVERLPDDARDSLSTFVGDLSIALQPAGKRVGIFALPSTQTPSDVVGGNAFDLPTLAQYVDRLRVATLDFSVGTPGPTIDSGWAVDAVRFAQQQVSAGTDALPIYDIAAPLYGWDFSDDTQRSVTWLEATGLAQAYGATPARMAGGEEQFFYTDEYDVQHTVVYDDASSTTTFLHAWDPITLPASVGVVLWGFGAEDPATFASIAGALP